MPFRDAHELAGECVRVCESRGLELDQLSDADFAAISAHLTPQVRSVLTVSGSMASRSAPGGTAPARVREQLDRLRAVLSGHQEWAGPHPPVAGSSG